MEKAILRITGIIGSLISLLGLYGCSLGYEGPVSDHFDGTRFFGQSPSHGFSDMVKWIWEMETVEWPDWVEDEKQPAPPLKVDEDQLRVTYINHATVLIQMDGVNILTDPIWSMRAGPFSWMGVKRIRNPGIDMKDLPKIDFILISHDHYDHLDLPSLKQLAREHHPMILVGLGIREYLVSKGIEKVVELDWWQSYNPEVKDIGFTFVPAEHNSGRWPLMGNRTLWGGYIVDSPSGQVYFAGDTGFGDFVYDIGKRFQKIRLAILPIGSYEKRWFMKSGHMNPDDAVKVASILKAKQSMGIHYATFAEHPEQTIDAHELDLKQALNLRGFPEDRFLTLQFGEGKNIQPFNKNSLHIR